MRSLAPSELIIHPNGSIYHLHLKPGDVAQTIITVGDQDRVELVSKHFDTLELTQQNREFKTHTGTYKGKRITVLSTGIGPDNIDIVFNELDALFNIDFETRTVKEQLTSLQIIRVGTSGTIQEDIALNTLLISEAAVGFDNLIRFYEGVEAISIPGFEKSFLEQVPWDNSNAIPYCVPAHKNLLEVFSKDNFMKGITATNVGFYGPQGRSLRVPLWYSNLNTLLANFRFKGTAITNLEMETAAIYAMSALLGHQAISCNAILANRVTGTFSEHPKETIEKLICKVLDLLTT